jgi:2-haloacid dehalogenase
MPDGDMTNETSRPRAVVFDLGGVLIDWNPRHLYRKLFGDRVEDMERFLAEVCTQAWNERHDAGLPYDNGVAELQAAYPQVADLVAAYHHRWDEMLAGALEETVEILSALRARGLPLYALTNFSAEKFPIARERFEFLGWFDGIVVSGEEKLIKPDKAIFDLLTDRYGLDPRRTLFIDDVERNVQGAAALGFQVHHFTGADRLRISLREAGLLPD